MTLAVSRYFPQPDDPCRRDIERYIGRMTRLINDMGDLVQIERGSLTVERRWLDITQLTRDVVDAYVVDAMARRISLTLEGATSPLWVIADAQRMLQVLSNVLDNALKFTPPHGSIQIDLVDKGASVQMRVRDDGRGISAERLPNVFDLYAGATASHGMGIGLTVARRIIELHDGSITVLSEGLNKGTEVVITLPASHRT